MKRIIFLLLLFVSACSQHNEPLKGPVVLDVFNSSEPGFSFKSIELIPLDTPDEALVGDANQLKVYIDNNKIYIANRNSSSGIHVFTLGGEYINTVGEQGEGPEEFLFIHDLIAHGDTLEVMTNNGTSTHVTGFNINGGFLYKIETDVRAYSFEKVTSGYVFATSYNYPIHDSRVYVTDWSGEVIDSLLPNTTQTTSVVVEDNFVKEGKNIYYREFFKDTVYTINENIATPTYVLDFGEYAIPKEFFTGDDLQSGLAVLNNQKGSAFVQGYFESPQMAYFQFNLQKSDGVTVNELLYNKNIKELSIETIPYIDDSFYKYPLTTVSDNKLVFLVYPYLILNERDDFEQLPLSNPEILNSLHENDNPILLICEIN